MSDPPNARRAYVGNREGIRPTEPEIDAAIHLLGAVRPHGELADLVIERHAQPHWSNRIIAKAKDGAVLGFRGIGAALDNAASGARLEDTLPERPWELVEITRQAV